jgi:hypothetical protein
MTDATIEEQVERAMAAHDIRFWSLPYQGVVRLMMRDLLAGKFREPQLPEIVPPPWISGKGELNTDRNGQTRVEFHETTVAGWTIYGPWECSKREAIEAFNAAFTRKDER